MPLSGTVTIRAGDLSATVLVSVLNDTVVEGTETVQVALNGTSAGTVIDDARADATLNVLDNDTAAITFSSPTIGGRRRRGTARWA